MTSPSSSTVSESARADLRALALRKGDGWMLALYVMLVALRFLADAPKDKELRADLYILF
jgi:hypothetical protein